MTVSPSLVEEVKHVKRTTPQFVFQDYVCRTIALKFAQLTDSEFEYLLKMVDTASRNNFSEPLPHYTIRNSKNYNRVFSLLQFPVFRNRMLRLDYLDSQGETIFVCLMNALVRDGKFEDYKNTIARLFPEVRGVEVEIEGEYYSV